MPTLDFKGKSFVYAHHLSVPFRELVIDEKKSLPANGQKPTLDDNLIIHGDNLHALKALLPVYAGKVDCIFIDPPYNTGNEGWCYNDNVRSPLMREWLKRAANPVDKHETGDGKIRFTVLETKGLHLTGNEDTQYKARLFELLTVHSRSAQAVGELKLGVREQEMRFELLLENDWNEKLPLALGHE